MREEHHELFSAGPEECVQRAQPLVDERHQFFQDAIAFRVTEDVIDILEAIDVEEQQRRALAEATATLDRRRERDVACAGG